MPTLRERIRQRLTELQARRQQRQDDRREDRQEVQTNLKLRFGIWEAILACLTIVQHLLAMFGWKSK